MRLFREFITHCRIPTSPAATPILTRQSAMPWKSTFPGPVMQSIARPQSTGIQRERTTVAPAKRIVRIKSGREA